MIISAIFVQSADYSIFFPINIYFIPSIYKINNKILIERPEFFQVNIQNIQYKYKFNRLCFYGIGKTSFLKLLSGSYYNHKKHVYINNYDLSKYYYKNKLIIYKYHGVYDSLYNEILDLQKNNIIPLIDHSVLPYIQKYLHNIPAPIIITSDIPIDGFTNIELKHKI